MLPQLIDESHIKKLTDLQEQQSINVIENRHNQLHQSDDKKEEFITVYRRCLSPSIACKQAEISVAIYKQWKAKDPLFCVALNDCILSARDELVGAAIVRATGYLTKDEETESGYEEDASGKPKYKGGSDLLAAKLLDLKEDSDGKSSATVNVSVNIGNMLGEQVVIEAE